MCLINCSRADMIENPKVRKVLNEVASWRSNVWVGLRIYYYRYLVQYKVLDVSVAYLERHVEPVVKSFGSSSQNF